MIAIKVSIARTSQYLDNLNDTSSQGANRLFVLSFEDNANQPSYKRYFLPTVETKDYSVMIDGKNFFDQSVKNNSKTYERL